MASARPLRAGERYGGGALALLQAALFGVAAILLPWRFDPVFSSVSLGYALLSGATAAVMMAGRPAAPRWWRAQAFAGLVALAWYVGLFVWAGAYLAGLYGPLGLGLGAAIQLLLAPGLLVVLPGAIWAIAATGGLRTRASAAAIAVLVIGVGSPAGYWWVHESAGPPALELSAWARELSSATTTAGVVLPLHSNGAIDCEAASGRVRALAVYRGRFGVRHRCVGGDDLDELQERLRAQLEVDGARRPVKLDLIWQLDDISASPQLATSFRLRAGRDGVCGGGRCLAPWQLAATEAYTAYQPVPVIPDLKIGVDPAALRRALQMDEAATSPWKGLFRARTLSLVLDASGQLVPLDRLRPLTAPIDDREAVARAERFLIANQRGDGRFHYLVDPFRGPVDTRSFSIARQAGTAFALCEWGSDAVRDTAEQALAHLLDFTLDAGDDATALGFRGNQVERLGPTSLTLAAFGMCKRRFGFVRFDPLMVRLTRFVLALQDPATGRFAPQMELAEATPQPGPHQLYADGQAVLALILVLEATGEPGPLADAFAPSELAAAIRLAMSYVTGPYWPWPLRSFFFLEENWHCLAAKAALGDPRVRDADYERFCLDLVRWRSRLVQTGPEGDDGAYHFAHVSAPYTTPTAGFLEAGSAGLEIAKARGESAPALEAALRRALDFMVRAQWDETSCFACTRRLPMVGAYGESLASTVVRVDFVQHAMAGMAGTRRALDM